MTFFVGFIAALVFGEPVRALLGFGEMWASAWPEFLL